MPYSADKQTVKDLKIQDSTGEIIIALWRDLATIPCFVGQQLSATRCKVTEYNNQAKLQCTWLSTISVSCYNRFYTCKQKYTRMSKYAHSHN